MKIGKPLILKSYSNSIFCVPCMHVLKFVLHSTTMSSEYLAFFVAYVNLGKAYLIVTPYFTKCLILI